MRDIYSVVHGHAFLLFVNVKSLLCVLKNYFILLNPSVQLVLLYPYQWNH